VTFGLFLGIVPLKSNDKNRLLEMAYLATASEIDNASRNSIPHKSGKYSTGARNGTPIISESKGKR